jgi:hypothetical protein
MVGSRGGESSLIVTTIFVVKENWPRFAKGFFVF